MQNTKTFSLEIEKMAQEKSITHMDAVLEYCKRKEIEPESVTRLISKSLKDKIEANARDLNYLPNHCLLDTLLGLVWTIFTHRLHHFVKGEGFTD